MNDDDPTGRDIRTIWKTIAVVGGALVAVGGLAIIVISWGSTQGETNVAQNLRISGLERDIEANAKRIESLERKWDWHQRGHAPSVGSGGPR